MFGSDDDTDFIPTNNSNSKLASLFSGVPSRDDGDTTFTFAAPRQPKANAKDDVQQASPSRKTSAQQVSQTSVPSAATSNKLSIIVVKAVHTYKLEDGQYISQGKLGAAILGNSTLHVYQLLLYKGKQQHITSARITHDFKFTVQADKYSTFYNDKGENWSIHFEDDTDGQEFAREICLARVASEGGGGEVQRLATQVLALPYESDGHLASVGDSMEIFYSVRTYSSGKLGQLIESNRDATKPQRVKIRMNVWEEGLIGVSKGTKIMILLPPTMVHPWKSDPRCNATSLAVEVEASRLKQARKPPELAPSRLPAALHGGGADSSAADSGTDDQSVRARAATISEALTGGGADKTHRASIISRMARMGQATLPPAGRNRSDSEETGDDSSPATSAIFKASKTRVSKSRSTPAQASPSAEIRAVGVTPAPSQMTLYQPMPAGWPHSQQQPYSMAPYGLGQFPSADGSQLVYPLHSGSVGVVGTPTGTPTSSDMSVFLSEARAHNAEVRMAVSKVGDKVDSVISKLDRVDTPRATPQLLDSSSLIASVQKIVADNEALQAELSDKRGKLEVQNERIYQLLNTSHRYLEQNSASSSDTDVLVASLRGDKTSLAEQLARANEQVEALRRAADEAKTLADLVETQRSELAEQRSLTAQANASTTSLIETQRKELEEQRSRVAEEVTKRASATSLAESQRKELDEQRRACAKMSAELAEQGKRLDEKEASLDALREKLRQTEDKSHAHCKTIAELERSMQDLQSFKEVLERSVGAMSQKVRSGDAGADELVDTLTERYTAQIRALEAEGAKLRGQIEALKEGGEDPAVGELVDAKVKRVMNSLFRCLRGEFETGAMYDGETVRQTAMRTIRDVTCHLTGGGSEKPDAGSKRHESQTRDEARREARDETVGGGPDAPAVKEEVAEPTEDEEIDAQVEKDLKEEIADQRDQEIEPPVRVCDSGSSIAEEPELPPIPDQAVEARVAASDETKSAEPLKAGLVSDAEETTGKQAVKPKSELKENVPAVVKMEEPEVWRPQPPPPPLFDDDDDEDSWLS